MPEGDTILRAARTLARVLEGRRIEVFRSPLPKLSGANLAGRTVVRVEPRGKHLLFLLDDGRALHSHMRMTGSWHVYRPGEAWQKPDRLARAVLETEAFVAVCFNAPVVELLSPSELARHPSLSRLGPDVLSPTFDSATARERLKAMPRSPIGEALLAQGAIAGIGNIYKSEALFASGVSPFAPVAALSDEWLDRVIGAARRLMSANVDSSSRTTTRTAWAGAGRGSSRYFVYDRSGRPCFVCGGRVRMRRQGEAGRSTYWCPGCQKEPGNPGAVPP